MTIDFSLNTQTDGSFALIFQTEPIHIGVALTRADLVELLSMVARILNYTRDKT